jgi:uncharacterized protein (DUF362 family)
MRRIVERPALQTKSKVAITKAKEYVDAEKAVREAIDLLGGMAQFCGKGDVVMIKPNLIYASHPDEAETTHPAVLEAVVRVAKETGAYVKVGEQTGWHCDPELAWRVTGLKEAAERGGADEVVNWENDDFPEYDVPNGRAFGKIRLPKSLVEADVVINVPKMKCNLVQTATLGLKSWVGAFHNSHRTFFHKNKMDMGAACTDVAKVLGAKLKLNVLDGVYGMEGSGPHAGLVVNPGVIIASSDVVAFDAVSCAVMGMHPLEIPATQMAHKDGLGTGDLDEIDVLGTPISEALFPFKRPFGQYISRWPNVKEFYGGACQGCWWALNTLPPFVGPDKKYALIVGARAMIGEDLSDYDEVWLIGKCASSPSHQLEGFMDKVNKAKSVVKISNCPGYGYTVCYHHEAEAAGTVYEAPDVLLADMSNLWCIPDVTDQAKLEDAIARREQRQDMKAFVDGCTVYYGADEMAANKPTDWVEASLDNYAHSEKSMPEPEKKRTVK